MGKTSPFTGTQKKANKAKAKTEKYFAEESVKEHKHNKSYRRSAQHDYRQIAKGKYAPPTDVKALSKEFAESQKYAKTAAQEQFKPIAEKAMSDYQRFSQPSIASQYEAGSGNQQGALKQGNEDLQRSLASDFAGLQNSIAGNYMNQLSSNRNQNINTRFQALNAGMGQPASPISLGMQSAYNQPQGGTSGMGGTIVGGLLSAGGLYAGSTSGSAAITAGLSALAASSREIKENIKDYEKGLEIVRELDVKKYDYTIPIEGRQDGHVGLIAEDVPEEFTGMIGAIKGVDMYGLIGLLVNCVKQLDKKVKLLEAR